MKLALGELIEFSERLPIPRTVTDEAARIYRRSLERGVNKRRPLVRIAASSLYAACRENEVPATLAEVAAASGLDRIVVASCYRLLVEELNLKIPVADPAECLANVASRAKTSPKVEADAREILSAAEKAGITAGVFPQGLAAAALYLASLLDGEALTQIEAAEAAGVREATVRKQCKRLRKVLGTRIEIPRRKRRLGSSGLEANRSIRVEVLARSRS